jgi:hypothetical protein
MMTGINETGQSQLQVNTRRTTGDSVYQIAIILAAVLLVVTASLF